ncbi:MAG: hypothetical protein AAFQ67_00745 [Pseudomonadota bacterium]
MPTWFQKATEEERALYQSYKQHWRELLDTPWEKGAYRAVIAHVERVSRRLAGGAPDV